VSAGGGPGRPGGARGGWNAPDAPFSLAPEGFAWGVGMEDTFIAQTDRVGERMLDEYALTHHYLYWREDLDRVAALGVRALRYGIPWYKVEPEPGRFDWEWVDRALGYAAERGLTIIADLVHYGTPLWLDNGFLNASYAERVADYAGAFAARYGPLVSHYTPLNEPLITVDLCGARGIWPPYLRGDDGAVKVLRALARGIVLSVEAIRAADPAAVIVHVDAAGETLPARPDLAEAAALLTARTFIATDLITGGVGPDHPLAGWLGRHGMSDADLAWHRERGVALEIVGVNYYPEYSVRQLTGPDPATGPMRAWGGVEGLERAVTAVAARYGRPVLISETSTTGDLSRRAAWLRDSVAAVARLRAAGTPLVGYIWWPLFDMIDWSYRAGARPVEEFITRLGPHVREIRQSGARLTAPGWHSSVAEAPLDAFLAPMGLYSLQLQFDGTFARVATPLVAAYHDVVTGGPDVVGRVIPPPPAPEPPS
jgi:beta-glucosidase